MRMNFPVSPPESALEWTDDGYTYAVTFKRRKDSFIVEVCRVLASGKMAPVAGRSAFPYSAGVLLRSVLEAESPLRTRLVDQIIRGDSLTTSYIAEQYYQQVDLWTGSG